MCKFSGGGCGRCSASGASRARADDVGRGRGKEGRSRPSQAPGKAMVHPVLRLQDYDMCNRDRGYSSTSNPVHNARNSFYTALQPDKNRPPTLAQPYVVSKPGVSFFVFFFTHVSDYLQKKYSVTTVSFLRRIEKLERIPHITKPHHRA